MFTSDSPLRVASASRFWSPRAGASGDSAPDKSAWGVDQMAIGLSGLCLVHCLASALFFASVASVGALVLNPLFHEIGLVVAIGFGLMALVRGVLTHGYLMPFGVGCFGLGLMAGALSLPHDGNEIVATMVGVLVVALGHDLNMRAAR